MYKYLSVFGTSFRQESKTLANSITSVFGFAVMVYVLQMLWSYIYGGSGAGQVINGYSLEMMIWYLVIAEVFMFTLRANAITRAYSNDIKSGKIAYQLNKPYNYYTYQVFSQSATFIWKLIFVLPIAIIMGLILVGPIANFSIAYVVPMLISVLLAIFIQSIVYGAIGLLAFWIEDPTPFTWIVSKFLMIFGMFFPPEFFPAWISSFITYGPIYAMMSGPCKLVANFSWELFLQVSITQVVYMVIFLGISVILYKSGIKKVNVYGG